MRNKYLAKYKKGDLPYIFSISDEYYSRINIVHGEEIFITEMERIYNQVYGKSTTDIFLLIYYLKFVIDSISKILVSQETVINLKNKVKCFDIIFSINECYCILLDLDSDKYISYRYDDAQSNEMFTIAKRELNNQHMPDPFNAMLKDVVNKPLNEHFLVNKPMAPKSSQEIIKRLNEIDAQVQQILDAGGPLDVVQSVRLLMEQGVLNNQLNKLQPNVKSLVDFRFGSIVNSDPDKGEPDSKEKVLNKYYSKSTPSVPTSALNVDVRLTKAIENNIPLYCDAVITPDELSNGHYTKSHDRKYLIFVDTDGVVYKVPTTVIVADVVPFTDDSSNSLYTPLGYNGWLPAYNDLFPVINGTMIHTSSSKEKGLIVRYLNKYYIDPMNEGTW